MIAQQDRRRTGGPAGSERESGVLDGGDVELQLDLLGDEHAAGLERGVPGEAPVLAVDGDLALEAHAEVAERVLSGAGLLEHDGDGLAGVLDGQVTGDGPLGAVALDLGRGEGDGREGRGVEEVGGLQVTVAVGRAGVDAGDVDGRA